MFRGGVLNAFHQARHDQARRPCRPGEAFCVRCKKPQSLVRRTVKFAWRNELAGCLGCACPTCSGANGSFLKRSGYQKLVAASVKLSSGKDD